MPIYTAAVAAIAVSLHPWTGPPECSTGSLHRPQSTNTFTKKAFAARQDLRSRQLIALLANLTFSISFFAQLRAIVLITDIINVLIQLPKEDKTMKPLTRYLGITLLSLPLLCLSAVQAEESGDRHGQQRFEQLVERLDLDEAQIAHFNAVKESQQQQRQDIETDKKALQTRIQALQADFRQQLEGVWSSEQLAKFDDMRERRQHKMGHRKGGMKPHSRS